METPAVAVVGSSGSELMSPDHGAGPPSEVLRASARLRLALAEQNHASANGAIVPPWVADTLPSSPSEAERLLHDQLVSEARFAVVRLKRLMRHEAFPELDPDKLKVVIDRKLSFEARVSGSAESGALVELSIGTLLAIDDAILGAACEGLFLANAGPDTEELDEAIPFLTRQVDHPTRLHDYGAAATAEQLLAALSRSIPRASWRLLQCDCLAELVPTITIP